MTMDPDIFAVEYKSTGVFGLLFGFCAVRAARPQTCGARELPPCHGASPNALYLVVVERTHQVLHVDLCSTT